MTEYFNPAPVVVGLVFPEPQKVVTITRSIEPFIGQDALPGGYVEREPWREALAREINDEAHISVSTDPQHMQIFDAHSTPDNTRLLIFAVISPCGVIEVRPFKPTNETSARQITRICRRLTPPSLCFPLHELALKRYIREHCHDRP
jgi:ADP-ribose pyrophosphatase YjhB (NUDIX family)